MSRCQYDKLHDAPPCDSGPLLNSKPSWFSDGLAHWKEKLLDVNFNITNLQLIKGKNKYINVEDTGDPDMSHNSTRRMESCRKISRPENANNFDGDNSEITSHDSLMSTFDEVIMEEMPFFKPRRTIHHLTENGDLREEITDLSHSHENDDREVIYDSVPGQERLESDDSWTDSEFESYSDDLDIGRVSNFVDDSDKISDKRQSKESYLDDNEGVERVALPPQPAELSDNQIKRRHVVANIIDSEQSYIQSMQFILMKYCSPLVAVNYLRDKIRGLMRNVAELIQYHKLFHMELKEAAQKWDETESIGDVFTASFSKLMVIDSYSEYVNSFASSMEDIRKVSRQKQSFADMLSMKSSESPDRLSIFGLMVKPVQRFPQMIMFLQDLLKYTPSDHHDRMKLQRALTELEEIAHQLNDRKRESDQKLEAKKIISNLLKDTLKWRLSLFSDTDRFLVRQDDFSQVIGHMTPRTFKQRRLILLSDLLICVRVRTQVKDMQTIEDLKIKWFVNLKDVELKETSITPDTYRDLRCASRWQVTSLDLESSIDDPTGTMTELLDLIHDHSVLSQIQDLTKTLRQPYPGVTEHCVKDTMNAVQMNIYQKDEQARLISGCCFVLDVPIRAKRRRYVFKCPTAESKEDWLTDFHLTQLHLHADNNPSWNKDDKDVEGKRHNFPALFVKNVSVDIQRNHTKIQCVVPVTLPASEFSTKLINHLWVCGSAIGLGQVSIIALQCNRPHIVESFIATDDRIVCAEFIPGLGKIDNPYAFSESTVWMSTDKDEIIIFSVHNASGLKRQSKATFKTRPQLSAMKYLKDQLFVALSSGHVAVYSRNSDGVWNISCPTMVTIGYRPVVCLHLIDEFMLCTSGTSVCMLDPTALKIERVLSLDCAEDAEILQVAWAGMGLWISYRDSSFIHLFHLESMSHLQDINVASIVKKALPETCDHYIGKVIITYLTTSKGLLWIGTNTGHILTLPLPRLREGVPQISGRPDIACHGHRGPVKFIIPLYCRVISHTINSPVCVFSKSDNRNSSSSIYSEIQNDTGSKGHNFNDSAINSSESVSNRKIVSHGSCSNSSISTDSEVQLVKEDLIAALQVELQQKLMERAKRWKSTPNLNAIYANIDAEKDAETTEDVTLLYGSLMKDFDCQYTSKLTSQTLGVVGRHHYLKPRHWRKVHSQIVEEDPLNFDKPNLDINENDINTQEGIQSCDCQISEITNPVENTQVFSENCLTSESSEVEQNEDMYFEPHSTELDSKTVTQHGFSKCVTVVSGGDGYRNSSGNAVNHPNRQESGINVWMYKADF